MTTSLENKVVLIYENELKFIKSFDLEYTKEKILFTLLVVNKLNNFKGSYETNNKKGIYQELATISNINIRTYEKRKEVIRNALDTFSELGLINIQSDFCIEILFSPNQDDHYEIINYEMIIKIFDKLGHYYDNYSKKNKIKFCKCCESPIQIVSNSHKYCTNCSKMLNKLSAKKYMAKTREKAVNSGE